MKIYRDFEDFKLSAVDYATVLEEGQGNPAPYISSLANIFNVSVGDGVVRRLLCDGDDGLLQALYALIKELEKLDRWSRYVDRSATVNDAIF